LGGCALVAACLVSAAGGTIAAAAPDGTATSTESHDAATSSEKDGTTSAEHVAQKPETVKVESTEGSTGETQTMRTVTTENPVSQEHEGSLTVNLPSLTNPDLVTTTSTDTAVTTTSTGTAETVDSTAQQTQTGSDSTPPGTVEPASDPVATVSYSPTTEPTADAVAPEASTVQAPTVDPPAAEAPVSEPAPEEVTVLASLLGPNTPAVAPQPTPPAATDVISAVQYLLTSMAATAVAILQMPGDLASLLGFPGMTPGTTLPAAPGGIGGSLYATGPSSPATVDALARPTGQWTDIMFALARPGSTSLGDVTAQPMPGGVALTAASYGEPVSGAASEPDAVAQAALPDLPSILKHTVDAVFSPFSLTVLAALALPGIAGLFVVSGAGTMVGYRQARAAMMLRAVGIARFVKTGPLGVVRAGSLVALHSRSSRAAARKPGPGDRLESVA
jgi:hypothetical protein